MQFSLSFNERLCLGYSTHACYENTTEDDGDYDIWYMSGTQHEMSLKIYMFFANQYQPVMLVKGS